MPASSLLSWKSNYACVVKGTCSLVQPVIEMKHFSDSESHREETDVRQNLDSIQHQFTLSSTLMLWQAFFLVGKILVTTFPSAQSLSIPHQLQTKKFLDLFHPRISKHSLHIVQESLHQDMARPVRWAVIKQSPVFILCIQLLHGSTQVNYLQPPPQTEEAPLLQLLQSHLQRWKLNYVAYCAQKNWPAGHSLKRRRDLCYLWGTFDSAVTCIGDSY